MELPKGTYTRSPERGFRKLAMAFWDAPKDGTIYGHLMIECSRIQQFQADVERVHGIKPSLGQLLGRGIANALMNTPQGNAKIIWGQAYLKDTVDVYYQVDVGDGADLSGVVVPDVGRKTCVEVAQILKARADKLRKGKDEQYEKTQKGCLSRIPSWVLRPLLGFLTFLEYNFGITPSALGARPEPFGTVMVTNVSHFGIDVAYAPLVPVSRVPFVSLLGQVTDQPVVRNGEIVIAPVCPMSATFDHRLLDGNKIGRIVRDTRAYLDDPYQFEAEALGMEIPPFPWELEGQDPPAPASEGQKEGEPSADAVEPS
ncbi:MAG TPA: hypothetical protein DEA08_20720 [Planctomycetes bacterium]|nr:hypothetical protein [Planctomycetota bacterium]